MYKYKYKKTKELVSNLAHNNLNLNGKMLIAYLFEINYEENNYIKDWSPIYKMPMTREILKEYITEYHQIKGAKSFICDNREKDDLVLIYKKNK